MHRRLRNILNPSSLLAMTALFVALGGVSYAAGKIGTAQIKNGAVTAPKLKKNAVTTAKIRANAVTGAKVAESTLDTVPRAAEANQAKQAQRAAEAGVADSAADAAKLGGVEAAQFGSGVIAAAVEAPPVGAKLPSGGSGSPVGFGEAFKLTVPVPLKLTNLFVKASGDASRPFTVSLRKPGGQSFACTGVGACFNPGSVAFKPGDSIELVVYVFPGEAVFTGATYEVGYRIVP